MNTTRQETRGRGQPPASYLRVVEPPAQVATLHGYIDGAAYRAMLVAAGLLVSREAVEPARYWHETPPTCRLIGTERA